MRALPGRRVSARRLRLRPIHLMRRCATTSPHRCSWIAPRTPCARSSMARACAAICTRCRCRGRASTASSASASCITCRSALRCGVRSPACCAREAGWCSASTRRDRCSRGCGVCTGERLHRPARARVPATETLVGTLRRSRQPPGEVRPTRLPPGAVAQYTPAAVYEHEAAAAGLRRVGRRGWPA